MHLAAAPASVTTPNDRKRKLRFIQALNQIRNATTLLRHRGMDLIAVPLAEDKTRGGLYGALPAAVEGPSACEMGWAAWDYRFCWSRRFRMAELGVLEHAVQKFGPILAL